MNVFKNLASIGFGELKKFLGCKVIENVKHKTIPIPESVIRDHLTCHWLPHIPPPWLGGGTPLAV